MKNIGNDRTLAVTLAWIVIAAASRLLPHPPNVTPLTAMALLAGAHLGPRTALAFPLAALFLSDLVLGLHSTLPFVYACLLATSWIGLRWLRERSPGRLLAAALASSLLFFVVTNLGTWLTQDLYSRDSQGLLACYTAAIPFFRNALLGDVAFTGLLFGLEGVSLHLARERRAAVA